MDGGEYHRHLRESGVLKTPRIREAFDRVDRARFVPATERSAAGADVPLPIGHAQTISQPWTVAFMLEALQPRPAQRVLDVGAGSGWTTALLAEIVGSRGRVFAIERVPELRETAERNVRAAGYRNVSFTTGDGTLGLPDEAPFDRIHVAAAARHHVPDPLREQLTVGGRLIVPVGEWTQELALVIREDGEQFHEQRFPGFQFVPLIEGSESRTV